MPGETRHLADPCKLPQHRNIAPVLGWVNGTAGGFGCGARGPGTEAWCHDRRERDGGSLRWATADLPSDLTAPGEFIARPAQIRHHPPIGAA